MRDAYITKSIKVNKTTRKAKTVLNNFFWKPLKSGSLGFIAFFSVLLITKLLSYLIGTRDVFVIEIEDLTVSLIGFILLYLFTLVEQFKHKNENKS